MKNLKMNIKLIIMAVLTSLIPIVVISLMSFNNAYNELESSVQTANARFSTSVIEKLTSFFEETMDDGIMVSMSDNLIESVDAFNGMIPKKDEIRQAAYEKMEEYLTVIQEKGDYTDVYVTNEFGKVAYSASMKEELENASLGSKFYVNNALKGNQSWSKLYFSDYIKDNMMVVTTPLVAEEGVKAAGTVSLLFSQPKLDTIVHEGIETLGTTANAYLINDEGVLLTNMRQGANAEGAALNVTVESTMITTLLPEIENGNTDYYFSGTFLNHEGVTMVGTATVVPIGDYYAGFILEVEEAEVYQSLDALGDRAIILTLAFVGIAILLVILISRSITKPLSAVLAYTDKISEYDISEDVPQKYLARRDEVGTIAKSVEHVTESLRELIGKVAETSENMTSSSQQVTSITSQFAVASQEVATTIGDIAAGANSQAESTMEGTERLFELGEVVAEDKEHIAGLNEATDFVGGLVESGLSVIKELSEKTHANNEAASAVAKSIRKTNESTNEIETASKMIADIAEQTNLLALNAAIEAARAGEQGKGFAVVAEEIRKLAEQSTTSTKNIDAMVQKLRGDANQAVEKMEEAGRIVVEQEESVQKTAEQFKQIAEAMTAASKAVEILNAASEVMKEKNLAVQEVMESLSAVAEENAASTEETSAAVEEQTASIDEIASASEHLAELAQQLQEQITVFKL